MAARLERVMGMPVFDVRDDVADGVLDRLFAWLREVDGRFSTFKPDSEISRLNRGELALADAHADVREVLARCEELRAQTRGYFDARAAAAAGGVDPTGLVKGRAVDRAAAILEQAGVRSYAVDAGGDLRVGGGPAPASGGASASSTRSSATGSPPSSSSATAPSPPPAPTTAATTSPTRTRGARRPASSPSRSSAAISPPRTRTRRRRSRWARPGRPGPRGCAATRR